jgi:hypothetical protein
MRLSTVLSSQSDHSEADDFEPFILNENPLVNSKQSSKTIGIDKCNLEEEPREHKTASTKVESNRLRGSRQF